MTITNIYPFATQDGKAIPLDILKPAYLYRAAVDGSLSVLPKTAEVAAFHAVDGNAYISFSGALSGHLAIGEGLELGLFVPAGTIVIAALPDSEFHCLMDSMEASLFIQVIEKWAGLALSSQFSTKI